MKYLLVFDTNTLYYEVEKKPDFKNFAFHGDFEEVYKIIEKLDIYENVEIGIPKIVWKELEKQNLDAYKKSVKELESKYNNLKLPFHTLDKDEDKDAKYHNHLDEKIKKYKEFLSNGLIRVEELDYPSSSCLTNIIKRAIEKLPPFEGNEKESDKGFKDTILWESILEYKKNNNDIKIILLSNDKIFNKSDEETKDIILKNEYNKLFNDEILIFDNRNSLLEKLKEIAKEEDESISVSDVSYDIDFVREAETYIESPEFKDDYNIQLKNILPAIEGYEYTKIELLKMKDLINLSDENKNIIYFEVKIFTRIMYSSINTNCFIFYPYNFSVFIRYDDELRSFRIEKIE